MKNNVWFFAGIAVCIAACSFGPKELVIDDFEGTITNTTFDYGASEGSSMKVTADTTEKFNGQQSARLEYELKSSGFMWASRGYKFLDVAGAAQWVVEPESIDWKKFNGISIAMFGRNTNGVFAFDIKDNGGEIWRTLLDDDFTGWKEIQMPFEIFFVRKDWQPETAEKNEIMDFPLQVFQFEPRMPGKGVVNFDAVKLVSIKKKK